MRKGVASFCGLAVFVISVLAGARSAPAQQPTGQVVKLGEGETLTISGFINATMFTNSGLFGGFGQGQNAEFAAAPASQPTTDKLFSDGDVRNTRINFTFSAGPVLGKWAPKATLETDFFGAFNGVPPFGDEQPQMRIRFAFVDFGNGRTTLRIGQFWSPMFAEVPVSVTHIAFPLGYGATGMVGWRYPGVFLYQDLSAAGAPLTVQPPPAAFHGSGPAASSRDSLSANNIGKGEGSRPAQIGGPPQFWERCAELPWSGRGIRPPGL